MNIGKAYWLHLPGGIRTFVPVLAGRKGSYTGLVFEADGIHSLKIGGRARVDETRLTERQVRGHVRKQKAVTKGALKLRKKLLEAA